jgi:hypothetical protein
VHLLYHGDDHLFHCVILLFLEEVHDAAFDVLRHLFHVIPCSVEAPHARVKTSGASFLLDLVALHVHEVACCSSPGYYSQSWGWTWVSALWAHHSTELHWEA